MVLFFIWRTGYSLFKVMDTASNSHDPLTHLSRERMVNQQGYRKNSQNESYEGNIWFKCLQDLCRCPIHRSEATVLAIKKIRNFYTKPTHKSSQSSVFRCEAKVHQHRTRSVRWLMLNLAASFQCGINTVFTQELIFKIVCLSYSLGFMKSSNTPTYKILTSS